jgi:hypothetical protein
MNAPSSSPPLLRSAKTGREICGKSFGRFGVLDSLFAVASNELLADLDRFSGGSREEGAGGEWSSFPFPFAPPPNENRRSDRPAVPLGCSSFAPQPVLKSGNWCILAKNEGVGGGGAGAALDDEEERVKSRELLEEGRAGEEELTALKLGMKLDAGIELRGEREEEEGGRGRVSEEISLSCSAQKP